MFDWSSSWQARFTEKGASGFNLIMHSQHVSLLRSEVGLRLSEVWNFMSGDFVMEEKVSYVNQAPFGFHSTETAFVASASSFPIAIGGSRVENLGAAEVRFSFVPKNSPYPYVMLDFMGQFGTTYQSYFAGIELGKDF